VGERGRSDIPLYVSALSVFEIEVGILKSGRPAGNRAQYGKLLGQLRTVPLDEDDALAGGAIRAELERLGTPIGSYDYLIAAQALRRGWILVTANEREFRRIRGLQIENWAK
jgi:tRNA(fMet)-specific endonuclease VapC